MEAFMRCFIALPIPKRYQQECQALVEDFKKNSLPVKWVAFGNFHVTLKFMGEVREHLVSPIVEQVELAAAAFSPFTLSLENTGAFPLRGKPRVLWVGVREQGSRIGALVNQLNRRLETLGFPAEARGFSPHLTLGRARSNGTMDRKLLTKDFATEAFQVSEIVLYESRLTPAVPIYTPLKIFPLI
jgi:RNA 2',3'-cyclic 3'-phosphodiesterase